MSSVESFLNFTEYDPNEVRTVVKKKITLADIRRDDTGYLVKDYGANNFSGDFNDEINFQLIDYLDDALHLYGHSVGIWSLTNGSHTIQEMIDNTDGLAVYFYKAANSIDPDQEFQIILHDFDNSNSDIAYFDYNDLLSVIFTESNFYFTILRSGSTCECKIYSDATRETLVDTLTLTNSVSYRYKVLASGRDDDSGNRYQDEVSLNAYITNQLYDFFDEYDELALRLNDNGSQIFTKETKLQAYNRAQYRIANFLKPEYIQDLLEVDADIDISSGEYSLDSLTYSVLNEEEGILLVKVTANGSEYWAYEININDLNRLDNPYFLPNTSVFYYIFGNKLYIKSSSDLETDISPDTQDFTDFTEYDPNDKRTVTSSKVTLTNITRGDDGYLVNDYGSAYFTGDFEHNFDVYVGSDFDLYATICPWALTNGAHTIQEMIDDSDGLTVYFYRNSSTVFTIYLQDFNGSSDTYTNFSTDTTYYLTVIRSSSTVSCYIYSDSTRETLVDTLSISCSTDYQYLVVSAGREGSTYQSNKCDGYIEDLDFAGGATADIYLLKVPDTITEYADTIYSDVSNNLTSGLYELFVTMAEYYCWEMEGRYDRAKAIKDLAIMQLETLNWKFKAPPAIIMGD